MHNLLLRSKAQRAGNQFALITQNSFGYGDIIRLVAYAKHLSEVTSEKVKAKYVVTQKDLNKTSNITKILRHYVPEFKYSIEVASLEKYSNKYTNLFRYENAKVVGENIGYPKLTPIQATDNRNFICVWHPFDNPVKADSDKMPIEEKEFFDFFDNLGIHVEYITYNTDIDLIFDRIRTAKLCVGYEGLGQQIAYHFNKPLITLSRLPYVSMNTGGPDSTITDNLKTVKRKINDRF